MEKAKLGAEMSSLNDYRSPVVDFLPCPPGLPAPIFQPDAQIMENPKTGAEMLNSHGESGTQIMENPETGAEMPVSPRPRNAQNVDFSKSGAETFNLPIDRIQSQLLARKAVLSQNGAVRAYWKNHRGNRLGPYYRVAYRDAGCRHSIYLGNSPQIAECVRSLLSRWQSGRREQLWSRKFRAKIRDSLRQEKAKIEALVEPLGFRMKGFAFHRRKSQ